MTTLPAAAGDYEALRARYDLVSFDPRGVGASAPVRCENDSQLDAYFAQDATPDDATEEKSYVESLKSFATACQDNSGKVLPHVGTTDAARDMDLLRQVLGDKKLYYMGISYGTELGGVYAHLFPKNVGRAVFDAVVDPTSNAEQGALGQAKGFQLALDNFAAGLRRTAVTSACCAAPTSRRSRTSSSSCSPSSTTSPSRPATAAASSPRRRPPTASPRPCTPRTTGSCSNRACDEAEGGDGALLLALSDAMNGREQGRHVQQHPGGQRRRQLR